MEQKYDINSFPSLLAIVAICAMPFVIVIMVPVLISGFVETLNVSARRAGFLASADMFGYTVGTISCFFLLPRVNWRSLITGALVLMILTNGLSAITSGYWLLAAARTGSGIGGGMATAVTFAAIGLMREADAAYGWWLVAQSVIAGICFLLFPSLLATWGIGGAFGLFAFLLLLTLLVVRYVPSRANEAECEQVVDQLPSGPLLRSAGLGVLAIFLYECGLMAPYSYVELLGRAGGLTINQTSLSLSLSMLGGIAGGLIAARMGLRFGRMAPILLGSAILIASLLMLRRTEFHFVLYTVCVVLLFGIWNVVLPYLLGALAATDGIGRAVALGNGGVGIALIMGPFLGALIIADTGGHLPPQAYFPVLDLGVILLVLTCIVCFTAHVAILRSRKASFP